MKNFQRNPSAAAARKTALEAFREDAAQDITSQRCIPQNLRCTAKIIAKSDFMLCGVLEADAVFKSRKVNVKWNYREGARVKRGSIVCHLSGSARAILACERIALNYLALLSGIATKSASAAKKYGRGENTATRKKK